MWSWRADPALLHITHPYHQTHLEPVKRTRASRRPCTSFEKSEESEENKSMHNCLCRRKRNIQLSLHTSRVHFALQSSIRQSSSGEDMETVTCIKQTKIIKNMHNRLIWDHPTWPYLSCTDMWVECVVHTVCNKAQKPTSPLLCLQGNELIGFCTKV